MVSSGILALGIAAVIVSIGMLGIINYLSFLNYLKTKKHSLLQSLLNKKSIIPLPYYINLDPRQWFTFVVNIHNEKDKRLKIHKILYLVTLVSMIIVSISLFIYVYS